VDDFFNSVHETQITMRSSKVLDWVYFWLWQCKNHGRR